MKGIKKTKNGLLVIARIRVRGKIVEKSKIIKGTQEEAKAQRQQLINEIRSENAVHCSLKISPKLFKDVIQVYRDSHGARDGSFCVSHESNINRLKNDLGDSEIAHFPSRFRQYLMTLRRDGKNVQANRFVVIAKAAFKVCVGLEYIKKSPISKELFPLSTETARDYYLPADKVSDIILKAAKNRRTCHIARALQYFFSVPCRKSEVLRMKVADIDLFGQRIRVHNGTTKNDAGIWKPIPPAMLKWFKRRVKEAKKLEEPIFCRIVRATQKNRKEINIRILPLGDFKNAWTTVRKEAGYPELRLHDSRHISATDMVNAGTPRTVVNAVAGWRTDMLKTYYHLDSDAALTHIQWPVAVAAKCEGSVKGLMSKQG